jgi:hypothetical protein
MKLQKLTLLLSVLILHFQNVKSQVVGEWPDATGGPSGTKTFSIGNALGIGTQFPKSWAEILYCTGNSPSIGLAVTTTDQCWNGNISTNGNFDGVIDPNQQIPPFEMPGVVNSLPILFPPGSGYFSLTKAGMDPIFICRNQTNVSPFSQSPPAQVPRFIVQHDGKTGINTANPRSTLDVVGNSNQNEPTALFGILSSTKMDRTVGPLVLKEYYTQHIGFYSKVTAGFGNNLVQASDQAILFTDGKQPSGLNLNGGLVIAPFNNAATAGGIRIDKDGGVEIPNLKINNTILTGDLELRGKLTCNGFVSKPKWWPDYVFESSYQLQSLDSVSKFIALNKHLPGMPSRSEILVNGQDIAEIQRLQQEKIEELTLYVIKLEAELKNLIKEK